MANDDEAELEQSPYAGLARKIRGGDSPSVIEQKTTPPTLIITRRSEAGSLRKLMSVVGVTGFLVGQCVFKVVLNGQLVGELCPNQSLKLALLPATHTLQISTSVMSSREIRFKAGAGKKIRFTTHSTLTGLLLTSSDNL